MHKSAYAKLRLSEEKVRNLLERTGLHLISSKEDGGFVTVIAQA
jgi:hypothetical protein